MAVTQADLDALKAARSSSVRSVTYADGRSVQFRTIEELETAIRATEADLAAASGKTPIRRTRVNTTKGF